MDIRTLARTLIGYMKKHGDVVDYDAAEHLEAQLAAEEVKSQEVSEQEKEGDEGAKGAGQAPVLPPTGDGAGDKGSKGK